MNILFYCPFKFSIKSKNLSSLGGIESLNVELCKELAKRKFKIFLATYCNREIKINGLTNIPINKITIKKNKIKFDLIISSNDPIIFDKFEYAKKILWMHNTLSIEKSIRKKKFLSLIKNKISVVFVSNYLKYKTSSLYFFNKKIVIFNFLSKKFLTNNINIKRNPIIVWSVQRNKGLDETIEMWINKIYPQNSKISFYIFGVDKKKYKSNETYLKKFNIFFFGRIPKEKLKNIYSKSLAMICLGYDETFCLNALEANACGLPLLTFGKTALRDYSINNYNAFILKNFDELSNKIISISNHSLNKKIIFNSFKFSKKFRLNKIINSWIHLIKKI